MMGLIRKWLAKRLEWLHAEWHGDPVWLLGRPWTPEELDDIDRTYTYGEFPPIGD